MKFSDGMWGKSRLGNSGMMGILHTNLGYLGILSYILGILGDTRGYLGILSYKLGILRDTYMFLRKIFYSFKSTKY
jgi:hypothetical protein